MLLDSKQNLDPKYIYSFELGIISLLPLLLQPGPKTTSQIHTQETILAAIREHANDIQTVVLNGVEFRTRHNNYGLRSPAKNNKTFQLTENIEFPDVPPEVLNSGDVMA